MNTSKLTELYSRSTAAKGIFDLAASAKSPQAETPVDYILDRLRKQGLSVSRPEVIEVFRQLETERLGNFLMGRRGMQTRFAWADNMTEVARRVLAARENGAASTAHTPAPAADMVAHSFVLRPGIVVRFELPSDLSTQEVERLATMLRANAIDFTPAAR